MYCEPISRASESTRSEAVFTKTLGPAAAIETFIGLTVTEYPAAPELAPNVIVAR